MFDWSLFPRGELTKSNIGSDNGLVSTSQQAIIWTNDEKFTYAYMHYWASVS